MEREAASVALGLLCLKKGYFAKRERKNMSERAEATASIIRAMWELGFPDRDAAPIPPFPSLYPHPTAPIPLPPSHQSHLKAPIPQLPSHCSYSTALIPLPMGLSSGRPHCSLWHCPTVLPCWKKTKSHKQAICLSFSLDPR